MYMLYEWLKLKEIGPSRKLNKIPSCLSGRVSNNSKKFLIQFEKNLIQFQEDSHTVLRRLS